MIRCFFKELIESSGNRPPNFVLLAAICGVLFSANQDGDRASSANETGPVLTSTVEAISGGAPVKASSANAFVDSVGVNTHWGYPSYLSHRDTLLSLLAAAQIRHVRDGAVSNVMALLASRGIQETMIIDPPSGVVPDSSYWSGAPPSATFPIDRYLRTQVPLGSIDAVEMPNELDIFHARYKWHPLDGSPLSTDPNSPNYYGYYGESVTKDCWRAIKSDSILASIKIIGPAVGTQVPSPYPAGSLYQYVDWGAFHPYPGRANTWTPQRPYATIPKYYWDSFEPSVNIGTDAYGGNPLLFSWYQPAFTRSGLARPMAATETGYTTSETNGGISVTAQSKYIPRLFAEYFRNGIVRTFIYELYDEKNEPRDSESNFGLIYNDLSPKPAYTALASLLGLLAEPGARVTPGSLAYTLDPQPNGDYKRTGYVHDLLLQKSDDDFYLLLWHEISDSSDTDSSDHVLQGAQRDLQPPALSTTITLPAAIDSAALYTYDKSWNLRSKSVNISDHRITVPATDTISVLRLSRASH